MFTLLIIIVSMWVQIITGRPPTENLKYQEPVGNGPVNPVIGNPPAYCGYELVRHLIDLGGWYYCWYECRYTCHAGPYHESVQNHCAPTAPTAIQ